MQIQNKQVAAKVTFFALPLILALLFLSVLTHFVPIPKGDAVSFLTTAIDYKQGHGLISSIWGRDFDLTGQQRFLYPPLFPFVVGIVSTSTTAPAVLQVVALLRVVCIFLMTAIIFLTTSTQSWPKRTVWLALALIGLAGMWTPAEGRPEALATIFLLVGVIASLRLKGTPLAIALGVLLGLIGGCQPVIPLLVACWIPFVSVYNRSFRPVVHTMIVGGISLVTVVLCIEVFGHGVLDMLEFFRTMVENETGGGGFFAYYIAGGRSPFLGVTLLLAIGAGLYLIRGERRGVIWVAAFATLVSIYIFAVSAPRKFYYVAFLAPLFYLLILKFEAGWSIKAKSWRVLASLLLAGILLVPWSGFVRYLFLSSIHSLQGQSYQSLAAEFATARAKLGEGTICTGLWWLTDDFHNLDAYAFTSGQFERCQGVIRLKSASGGQAIAGHQLVGEFGESLEWNGYQSRLWDLRIEAWRKSE